MIGIYYYVKTSFYCAELWLSKKRKTYIVMGSNSFQDQFCKFFINKKS